VLVKGARKTPRRSATCAASFLEIRTHTHLDPVMPLLNRLASFVIPGGNYWAGSLWGPPGPVRTPCSPQTRRSGS
jgi:hypothetical protein